MKLFDDTTNRQGSDADEYIPGQNAQGSYQNNPLTNEDSYQSNNPRQIPSNDSGYDFANEKYGQQDPEFQSQYQNQKKGGLAKQAGRAFGKGKDALGGIVDKANSPENRDKIKQEAKDRIKKYARDQVKDKLGKEIGDLSKDSLKKAGKDIGKNLAKQAGKQVGKQVGKEVGKVAVEGAVNVGIEGAVATAGLASAIETAGIGLIIAILIEIAFYLGFDDALDFVVESAKLNPKKAMFHAHRGAMSILMGLILIIDILMTFSVAGWIIGVPLMVLLNIYMFLGMFFPKIGLLQGLSKKLIKAIIFLYDLFAIIIMLTFVAGLFWWICDQSGLGTGFFASAVTKVVDWWNGNEFASTFNDICTQISKF